MKVAKLFAYLAVSLLLPWWLFLLMDNELNQDNETKELMKEISEKLDCLGEDNSQGIDRFPDSLFISGISRNFTSINQGKEISTLSVQSVYTFSEENYPSSWDIYLDSENSSSTTTYFLYLKNKTTKYIAHVEYVTSALNSPRQFESFVGINIKPGEKTTAFKFSNLLVGDYYISLSLENLNDETDKRNHAIYLRIHD